jgi:hypothetical protein
LSFDLSSLTEDQRRRAEELEQQALASGQDPSSAVLSEFPFLQMGTADVEESVTEAIEEDVPQSPYQLQLPDYSVMNVPAGVSRAEASRLAREQFPSAFGIGAPVDTETEPKEGTFFTSLYSGLMGSLEGIPGGAQALYGGVTGDGEAFEAGKARVRQADERMAERAGKLTTLEDVSQAYDDEGLISATAKWLELATETTGQSIGYMAPSLVGGVLLGRMGTVAGAMLAGPLGAAAGMGVGTLLGRGLGAFSAANRASKAYKAASIGRTVGRTLGYTGTQTTNYLASNLQRSLQEAEERGEDLTEDDYNVLGQVAIAGGQTALESLMVLLAGGSLVVGNTAQMLSGGGRRTAMKALAEQIDRIDNLSPLRRFVATMAEEEVAEVGQQALERLAAGETISPADEEAAREYIQIALTAIGPSMFFGGVGAANAKYQDSKEKKAALAIENARSEILQIQQNAAKRAEEEEALNLEKQAIEQRKRFLDEVKPSLETGRTAEDVHAAAESRNINSRDMGFHSFTRRLVGKAKLDDLTPQELEEVYQAVSALPVQEAEISLAIASKKDALSLVDSILKSKKKELSDKNILNALEETGLLGVDPRYVSEKELADIAASYRNRLDDLGLVSRPGQGARRGIPQVDEDVAQDLRDALSGTSVDSDIDVVVPQSAYDAVLRYARLENNGVYPDLEKFKEITGFRNDGYYQPAIDEAIARGDIANDGSGRITVPRTPKARKKQYAVEVKRGGGQVERLATFDTKKEADQARKDYLAEAKSVREKGRGPVGIPELSVREVSGVIAPNVLQSELVPFGPTLKPEPELVKEYEYEVKKSKEWVVKGTEGGVLSYHKTPAQARQDIKRRREQGQKGISSIPVKEDVFSVVEYEVGLETGKKTRARGVPVKKNDGILTEAEANAEAQRLRDKASGGAESFGRRVLEDGSLEEGLGLSAQDLAELLEDPVAFAEKKFPISQDKPAGADTKAEQLAKGVKKYLSKDRRLNNFRVEVVSTLEGEGEAKYEPVTGIIKIALDAPSLNNPDLSFDEMVLEANKLVDHELVHWAFRSGLITRGEYNVLKRAAARTPIKRSVLSGINREREAGGLEALPSDFTYQQLANELYAEQGQAEGWIGDDFTEEAIAFMAQDFGADKKNVTGKPANIFQKMGRAILNIGNAFRGAGFRSSDEVFQTLYGDTFQQRLKRDMMRDAYYKKRRHQEEYTKLIASIASAAYVDQTLQDSTIANLERTGVLAPSSPIRSLTFDQPASAEEDDTRETATSRSARRRANLPLPVSQSDRAELRGDVSLLPANAPNPFSIPEGSEGRVNRKVKRQEKAKKYRSGPGQPLNNRRVLKFKDGTVYPIGKIKPEDWVARVKSLNLSDQEITDFRNWYYEVNGEFAKVFGDQGPAFAAAWLMAQQNASPSAALQNALLVREQVLTGRDTEAGRKKGGLADDRLIPFWRTVIDQGLEGLDMEAGSQKLYDFVDSALGRQTRTWMGDNPLGGEPAVIDVHSARDVGFIDGAHLTRLKEKVENKSQLRGLKLDMKRAPTEAKYETSAEFLNEVRDYLNETGEFGGNFLRTSEVQALGWMVNLIQMGLPAQNVDSALAGSSYRISSELEFGEGAPYNQVFSRLPDLDLENQISATHSAIGTALGKASDLLGSPPLVSHDSGISSWVNSVSASSQIEFLATPETSLDMANALGYLLQQTEVWSGHELSMTEGGNIPSGANHFFVDLQAPELADTKNQLELWQKVLDNTEMDLGFSPVEVNGVSAMRIYLPFRDENGKLIRWASSNRAKAEQAMNSMLLNGIRKAGKETDFDIDVSYVPGSIQIARNDWTENKDGQGYLQRFENRPGVVEGLRDSRGAVEQTIEAAVARGLERQGEGGRRSVSRAKLPVRSEGLGGGVDRAGLDSGDNRGLRLLGDEGNPLELSDIHRGVRNTPEAQRAVYRNLGLEAAPESNTSDELRIYPLEQAFGSTVQSVDAKLKPWLDSIGWEYRVFGPKSGPNGKALYPDFQDPNTPSYDQGVAWLFDPSAEEGSFRDHAYTLAWRATHEVAHGLVNDKMTDRYGGRGRRAGAMGVVLRGPHHRNDTALTLADAMRAVDWEYEAFIEQRRILEEEFGIRISDEQFNKENSINLADAVYRSLTGQFGNPGEIGVIPTDVDPKLMRDMAMDMLRSAAAEMGISMDETVRQDPLSQPDSRTGGRQALSRSSFERDTRLDDQRNPSDRDKPTLPPNKPVPQTRDPKKLMSAVTWGYSRFNSVGKYMGKKGVGIPIYIPAGSTELFGERHIERHNPDIARNTPYVDTNEFLSAFFEQLKNSPKDLSSGQIQHHYDPFGQKIVFTWKGDGFTAPGVVVMKYTDQPSAYIQGPRYNVITAYANERYAMNSPEGSFASGPRQGEAVTTSAVRDFYDKDESFGPRSTGRRAASRLAAVSSESEQQAIDAYMGPGGMRQRGDKQSLLDSLTSAFRNYQDIPFWEEFRYQYIDKYDAVFRNEKAATAKLRSEGKLGLTIPEMASTSAHAMMMLKDRAGAFLEAMLKYGTIDFTTVEGGDWMDGTVMVNDMTLENSADDALMFVPGEGIVRRRVEKPGVYEGTGGLIKILSAIAKVNDSYVEKFFTYGRAVRAYRLDGQGKPIPEQFKGENMENALQIGYDNPEIAIAFANLQKWNQSLVDFAVKTGVLNDEQAKIWLEYADYVPFYLDTSGEMQGELREKFRRASNSEDDFKMLNSMLPKRPSKKYKGFSEGNLDDPIESTIKNSMALINEGMKNVASNRFLRNMVVTGDARRLDDSNFADRQVERSAISVYENGRTVRYYVKDPFLHDVMVGSFDGQGPLEGITKVFSLPARLLREGVTRMPDFLLANTTRDAILSWLTHSTTSNPISATTDSLKRIFKDTMEREAGGQTTQQRLVKAGAVGGLELKDVDLAGIQKRFSRRISDAGSVPEILTRTWDLLGDIGNFSESAARQRVFERTYDRELKRFREQGKERGLTGEALTQYADTHATGQAAFQAMEVLNFSRRGNSPMLRFLTATIPFLNARIQGLDVLYRNAYKGENTLGIDPDEAKRALLHRASLLFGAGVLYSLMHGIDDEDFENVEEYRRNDNWLIPLGPLATENDKFAAIPIPFEAGILLKIIPEQLTRAAMGESTGEGLRAVRHSIMNTLAFNPLPQAIRPLVEQATNYNFFTGQPIVPFFMQKLDQAEQYRGSTTAIARAAGNVLPEWAGMSPLEIDNLMRGYIGSGWNYIDLFTDVVFNRPAFGLTDQAEELVTQKPFFKRFLVNNLGRGYAEDYYRMRDEVEGVVTTVNKLKTRDPSRVNEYMKDNAEALRARAFVREADKRLKLIKSESDRVLRSDLSRKEKGERLRMLQRKRIEVFSRLPKAFGGSS